MAIICNFNIPSGPSQLPLWDLTLKVLGLLKFEAGIFKLLSWNEWSDQFDWDTTRTLFNQIQPKLSKVADIWKYLTKWGYGTLTVWSKFNKPFQPVETK